MYGIDYRKYSVIKLIIVFLLFFIYAYNLFSTDILTVKGADLLLEDSNSITFISKQSKQLISTEHTGQNV